MKQEGRFSTINNSFWRTALVVFGICIALYFLFFAFLGQITGHGNEIKVPNITKKMLKEGSKILTDAGFDIQVDSAYDQNLKPFTILAQQPEPGEIVKPGRSIFLTVNKAEPPQTPMPNLNGLSLRSAIMVLTGAKLKMGDTSYRPDIAQGAVLDQLYNGRIIRPGQMIPQGSVISLVLGDGLGNTVFDVPDIVGLTYAEAVAMLSANNLHFTAVAEGDITDTASATVYMQVPAALNELGNPNRLREGDELGFYFKQNVTPEELNRTGSSIDSADNKN